MEAFAAERGVIQPTFLSIMALTDDLHIDLLRSYTRAFEEIGYRAARFKQELDRKGGLATAQRMLKTGGNKQSAGFDRLLEAGKRDITLEFVVLQPKYKSLFTPGELAIAQERLDRFVSESTEARKKMDRIFPDELEPGRKYNEGAKKQVRVNRYERDPRARDACVKHNGCRCVVCDFDFESRYGIRGHGFIHVHHLRALAEPGEPDAIDPRFDLVPVCPNCHAMLHRGDRLLTIDELKALLRAPAV